MLGLIIGGMGGFVIGFSLCAMFANAKLDDAQSAIRFWRAQAMTAASKEVE